MSEQTETPKSHDGVEPDADDKPVAEGGTGSVESTGQKSDKGERLDEALEETFPSSDPVSVKITK